MLKLILGLVIIGAVMFFFNAAFHPTGSGTTGTTAAAPATPQTRVA